MEMKKIVGHTEVTFLVDDDAKPDFVKKVVEDGAAWLLEARVVCSRALNFATRALVTPDKVPPAHIDILYYYFGIPRRNASDVAYKSEINDIIKNIQKTKIGLQGDVVIADLSQIPGIAKAQLNCLNTIRWAIGKESATLAGLVFVDVIEGAGRYLKDFFKSSPKGVTMNPYNSPIYLNFEELWKQPHRSSVVTLIHEASHKFAQTTDEQYFPEESAWDKLQQGIKDCEKMIEAYDTFDQMMVQAQQYVMIGDMGKAITNVSNMDRTKAINNADGVANYIYEVADFETPEELKRVIAAIMK